MFHATTQFLFLATGVFAIWLIVSTMMGSWTRIGAALRGSVPLRSDAVVVRRDTARQAHRYPRRTASTSMAWTTIRAA